MTPADVQHDTNAPADRAGRQAPVGLSAPNYLVDQVELDFALDPAATIVTSRLSLRRNPAGHGGALRLDGERLGLAVGGAGRGGAATARLSLHQRSVGDRHRAGGVHARYKGADFAAGQYGALGAVPLGRQFLHPMRGGGVPPHHLLPRPSRCDGALHHHLARRRRVLPGAAVQRQPRRQRRDQWPPLGALGRSASKAFLPFRRGRG